MIIRRDEAFMTVCELLTPINSLVKNVGTGIFVGGLDSNNQFHGWIVTASHVAKETNQQTMVVISNISGRASKLPLSVFGDLTEWKHHPIADISAFEITPTEENMKFMEKRFFPLDHFNLEVIPVSRDFELTSIGFPHGLGTENFFSPLTFRSFASSGFVTLNRADTYTPSTFFCLENPSVGGYSGCPVFDLGYVTDGVVTTFKEKTICHGIMHGTMCDETGGKIALVTPSFYLKDLIRI